MRGDGGVGIGGTNVAWGSRARRRQEVGGAGRQRFRDSRRQCTPGTNGSSSRGRSRAAASQCSDSVVQANCRTRFTAADFDFIVRALSRSQRDAVSLVKLLTDADTRDSVLDHAALADAILSQNGHLSISPQFYFYVLTRSVLRQAGLEDRALCDYLASLLDEFTRTAALRPPPFPERTARRAACLPLRPARSPARGQPGAGVFPARAAGRLHAVPDRHVPRQHRTPPLAPGRAGVFVLRGDGPRELPRRRRSRGRAPPRADRRVQRTGRAVPRGTPRAQPTGRPPAQPRRRFSRDDRAGSRCSHGNQPTTR